MKLPSTLAVLLVSFTPSYAYILDPSCNTYKDIVVAGMKGAFDLAQAGADTLDTLATSNDGSGDVLQAQRDLFGFTFTDALTDGKIDPDNPKFVTARNVFNSVLKYDSNNGEPDVTTLQYDYRSLTVDDLVIICDFTRLYEGHNCRTEAPDRVCDRTLGIDWPLAPAYFSCKYVRPYSNKFLQAFVNRPSQEGFTLPSTMQLCPGFLAEMNLHESNILSQQGSAASLALNWAKYSYISASGLRAIDFLSTFDFTLLHEMTHAISKGATVDVDGSNSFGWDNAYVLGQFDGTRNAENFAFFGLGGRMISPKNDARAQRPMEDGSIQILAGGSGGTKRDLSLGDNLFGPRAMNPNITLTLDDTTATWDPLNTTPLVVSELSKSPVTISTGREYTFGTDTIAMEKSAVVFDDKTELFPLVSASATKTSNNSHLINSSNLTSRIDSTTFSTTIRGRDPSESLSLSSKITRSAPSNTSTSSARGHTSSTRLYKPVSSNSFTSSKQDKYSSSFTGLSGSVSHNTSLTGLSKSVSHTVLPTIATKDSSSFSTHSSSSTEALLVYNWAKATPTTTTGVSSATHDSHGWPIIPLAHCWFCPPDTGGGGGGGGIVIPDITGPGILPPGDTPPVGFSSNMPAITLDAAGDPTFDTVEPTSEPTDSASSPTSEARSSGSRTSTSEARSRSSSSSTSANSTSSSSTANTRSTHSISSTRSIISTHSISSSHSSNSTHSMSSCSTQTMSACELSYSLFTPAGASTANVSTITVSCSTATACAASLSGSSTSRAAEITVTPIYDFARGESWYAMQQKMLSEAGANATDAYITWSSGSSTVNSTRAASTKGSSSGSGHTTSSAAKTASSSRSKIASKSTIHDSSTKSAVSKSTVQSESGNATKSTVPTSTVSSKPGSASSLSSHTTMIASVHDTTSAKAITSCSLSSYTALKTTQSGMTVDVPASIGCACNDDWMAGIGSTVGSDSSTTYTCQVTSTHIAVSTAAPKPVPTTAAESVTTTAKLVSTASTASAYHSGTCNLHIFEVSAGPTQPLYVQLNVTDGSNTLLTSKSYDMKWGGTASVSSPDTKLPYDITVEFSKKTTSSKLRPRIGPPVQVANWQAWIISITAGTTSWDSTVNDDTRIPYCKVGGWNNGDFKDFLDGILSLGANQLSPTRQMDCYWMC
ncbi:hypothetical protein LOCC1_G006809 [Lachnellula occidentalis]|uniref:Lysine-specific metallo-endopeptidase domain-containing protein n=1 Tax=Lachnellula occidentalis TaxID=215460 RepID=A0A8H8S0Q5_9HELO|nr:hypothetical protein LOCC1_G006809 [Lachnellula occidentalis]